MRPNPGTSRPKKAKTVKAPIRGMSAFSKRPPMRAKVRIKSMPGMKMVPATQASDAYMGTAKQAAQMKAMLKKKAAYEKANPNRNAS